MTVPKNKRAVVLVAISLFVFILGSGAVLFAMQNAPSALEDYTYCPTDDKTEHYMGLTECVGGDKERVIEVYKNIHSEEACNKFGGDGVYYLGDFNRHYAACAPKGHGLS